MPTLGDVIDAMDAWYDPRRAESWDAVGLVCGERAVEVRSIHLAVDPVPATVAETVDRGAQLLITHHPLLLTGVHGVPADDPKGALVHRMIRSGIGHFVAHTNADVARPGVSDALGELLGLGDLEPLLPEPGPALDKLVVYVPEEHEERLVDALSAAGAGEIGDYDHCAWSTVGTGTFRPGPDSAPSIGERGRVEHVREARVEMVLPIERRRAVLAALRAAHPYEEVAFDLLPEAQLPGRSGAGRIGRLAAPMPLTEFTDHVARRLPATVWGVRAAGDPRREISTVAVAGGSGNTFVGTARRLGADAFVTADLKHHHVVEAVTERGSGAMALIDAGHWATEAPWLPALAAQLRGRFGTTVEVSVSDLVTDPWTLHIDQEVE